MSDKPHTPTTDLVRSVYVQRMTRHGDISVRQVNEEFDRFLTAAEQRGAERGWSEGTQAYMNSIWGDGPEEPQNPYRADQMEGDE